MSKEIGKSKEELVSSDKGRERLKVLEEVRKVKSNT